MPFSLPQKLLTEFIGTFFLSLTISVSVIHYEYEYIPFAIASTLMVVIYAGGHISGAHYNPAVTISVYLRGSCNKDDVLPYIASQILAAVIAALVADRFLTTKKYYDVELFTLGSEAVVAEFLFTFLLAYVILNVATTESKSGNGYYGASIALVVLAGAITVGSISLASFNPAVTSALIISGKISFSASWMHFLPQLVGAILATYVYKFTMDN
jgi:aquaporin Z